jgi:hypothetical protein
MAKMELCQHSEQVLFATIPVQKTESPALKTAPDVFVFNPFAEEHIAHGKAFTPVHHQAMLAKDLANLPEFLSQTGDVVLVPERPSEEILNSHQNAGFPVPEFVELADGRIDPASSLCQRKIGSLRPWAWAPDSINLLDPLFCRTSDSRNAKQCFNADIARLYSKAWSADFLRKVLARCVPAAWVCSEQEAGVAVDSVKEALGAIAAIRKRGHHRVVVKEAYGFAAANSIRLWEPEILPAQVQWLTHALEDGGQLVVEPWLERELDFSIQLEMGPRNLTLCGYTGLVNGRKGQFLANWAEPDYGQSLPANMAFLFGTSAQIGEIQDLYAEVFSLLEDELKRVDFVGPISIDSFVYRSAEGFCRLKPVVEINPRYTMGRLTLELMKHAWPGSYGLFRLVTRTQAHKEGFSELSTYARSLSERVPVRLEGEAKIREGGLCLNDPCHAQVCLATFEVGPKLRLPASFNPHGA